MNKFAVEGLMAKKNERLSKLLPRVPRFIIEPGFRLQKYTLGVSPEPRLGMKYIASDRLRFKVSSGYYSQNILSTTSDRDVVNLFYGFLSGPENLQNNLITPEGEVQEVVHSLQTAQHLISGFDAKIVEGSIMPKIAKGEG